MPDLELQEPDDDDRLWIYEIARTAMNHWSGWIADELDLSQFEMDRLHEILNAYLGVD